MKVSELRIGNWYMSVKFQVPVQLQPDDIYTLVDRADGAEIGHYISEMFEPIPLTEEWLEKFGFVKPKLWDCHHKGRLQVRKQMCYLIEEDTWKAHWIPANMEYVHQLQNLYFALTGEELILKQ